MRVIHCLILSIVLMSLFGCTTAPVLQPSTTRTGAQPQPKVIWTDVKEWRDAQEENSLTAYLAFATRHPQTPLGQEAACRVYDFLIQGANKAERWPMDNIAITTRSGPVADDNLFGAQLIAALGSGTSFVIAVHPKRIVCSSSDVYIAVYLFQLGQPSVSIQRIDTRYQPCFREPNERVPGTFGGTEHGPIKELRSGEFIRCGERIGNPRRGFLYTQEIAAGEGFHKQWYYFTRNVCELEVCIKLVPGARKR